jgi:hypothetical protein
VNDAPAGEASWSGAVPYAFQVSSSNLRPGDNSLGFTAPGGASLADVLLVDSVGVLYPREYVAVEGVIEFVGGAQSVQAGGFQSNSVQVYDITDPSAVQQLTGVQVEPEGPTFAISFYDDLAQRRYLALDAAAARRPLDVQGVRPAPIDLRAASNQADYLIVAPAQFFDALAPLVEHRTQGGQRLQLVDIEHVYDAFSNGVPEPAALRDFLIYAREAWAGPAPRFVLLVGKASYDYRDNLGGPNKNLVPTYLVPSPHLAQAASDNWFVAAAAGSDGDSVYPQMAIGRIPAKTPEQVRIAVQKILDYEAGLEAEAAWRQNAVFVTDDEEPIYDQSSEVLIQGLGPGMQARKVYLSAYAGEVEAARAEIVRQWNEGALLMTYIGHGSIDTWAAGPLFGSQFVDQIKNGDRLPILLTPTCLDGYFYHPEKDSLTEALLFKTDGGIVAGLVPTGLSLPSAQDVLMEKLFVELFTQRAPTLGEAMTRAKQQVDPTSPELREVLETFVLLGDPALRWE